MRASPAQRTPPLIGVLAAVGVAFIAIPIAALLIRAPWSHLIDQLSSTGAWTALRLSLEVSLAAAAISLVLGTPVAWVLARSSIPGRSVLRALVILPLVLPPVVGGIGLLTALGRSGVVGRWLDDGRDPAHVHDLGGDRRDHVRLDPARHPGGRSRAPFDRSAARAGRGDDGGVARLRPAPGDVAAPASTARRRARARLGASARGVRRHDHVRGEPRRSDADPAPRRLPDPSRPIPAPRS